MSGSQKKLSNSFSTGGGGSHFEAHVQASFVVLMLTGGYAPALPSWPIVEIKLQGKIDGFDTDDLIVYVENPDSKRRSKLLGQVKHSIGFTIGNKILPEVIQASWDDFQNSEVFTKKRDIIALITGPLTETDFKNVSWLLDQARYTKDVTEFLRNVSRSKFSPSKATEKLDAFRYHLKNANNDVDLTNDELYEFLNHFYLLGYDLGKEGGVVLSLLHSHISQFNSSYPKWAWSRVVDIVQTWNQNAGTIVIDKLPDDIKDVFVQEAVASIPEDFVVPKTPATKGSLGGHVSANAIAFANLFGSWDENNEADLEIIGGIISGD